MWLLRDKGEAGLNTGTNKEYLFIVHVWELSKSDMKKLQAFHLK